MDAAASRPWRGFQIDRHDLQPLLWLTLGVLASFVYQASVWPVFESRLPLPLFAPQAVILAVLLMTPARIWWACLLLYYALLLIDGVLTGLPLLLALTSDVADVIEPLIGAALVRRFIADPQRFDQLRDVSVYVGCVTLASVVGATWGAAMRLLVAGFAFWSSWPGWFLADVIASLILAPTIILWANSDLSDLRTASRARFIEAGLLSVALVGVGWLVFVTPPDNAEIARALLYLPVPILVWAAVRFGPRGLLTTLAVVTVLAIAAAANQVGPFTGQSASASVLTQQLFLLGVGMPLFLLSVLVGERQQAQHRLAESEERYRVMVRSLPRGAVLLFGADLRHEFADGQGLADVGLTKERIEGHALWQAFPSELAGPLEPRYRSALAGAHDTFELTYAGREYQMDALPIPDAAAATGMLVMYDITDQKRAEALAELDRARTAFFTNITHDLRTPLTLVIGPLQDALREGVLSREPLEMVYRNALRLQRLVNDLLDLSRIEAGRMNVAFQLTDLAAFTTDLASNFRPTIERAGLRLGVDIPPLPDDLPVYVDRDMMERVVVNLVSNAFNHTFEGEIDISLHPSDDRKAVELRVRDTGIGIPADQQARIFDRFHQVQGARSRTQQGSGIGLALVQQLVRLQGGTVSVDSLEGQGTTFTVRLPVGTAHVDPSHMVAAPTGARTSVSTAPALEDVLGWSDASESAKATSSDGAASSTVGRILVVDDNADMRRYVANILGEQWSVETVSDGAAALASASAQPPDLVLLDVMMPGMDGFEVLAGLRNDPATRNVPVIMLSARAGEEAAVEGLRAGVNDYVEKPFAAIELSARVRTQIEAARARAESEAAVSARDEFVGMVVHDLRHPVSTVNWHIQVLQRRVRRGETPSTDDFLQFLDTTQAGLRTLSTQIEELYDSTRLQAGRPLDLHLRPTDLVVLAQSVVRQYANTAEEHQLRFESAVPTLTGAWDTARLERVISNLLSNAIKYSPNGGEIVVRVEREAAWGVLSVEDHGLGIPEADQARIFERYARGSNVTGRVAGTGLGLSSARGIVEQHCGTIAVRSVEGEGSTFVIRLPLDEAPKG